MRKILFGLLGLLFTIPSWGACYDYTSATGTASQIGTPTPDNPIYPTFYKQGDMVLRKVGNIADTYDATTGKITRRVGVKVLDGTENFLYGTPLTNMFCLDGLSVSTSSDDRSIISAHFKTQKTLPQTEGRNGYIQRSADGAIGIGYDAAANSVDNFKTWLREQYAAGTPVTIYYPLVSATEENIGTEWCDILESIKIASTKYTETVFNPLNTALQNAISVVDSVVSNTIAQAASIATLQSGKQTRPDETCPAGKKCLLVEGTDGQPHWYEIVESILQTDYTVLEYISSSGTQYIDTGVTLTNDVSYVANIGTTKDNILGLTGIVWQSGSMFQIRYYSNGEFNINDGFGTYATNALYNVGFNVDKARFCKDDLCVTKTRDIVNNSTRIKTGVYDKVASLKIYDNETLVRNMIPVKRNSDGVLGMYDTVNNRFYTNAGSGTFVAGPVAE